MGHEDTPRLTLKLRRIATAVPALVIAVLTLLWVGQDCLHYRREGRELRAQMLQERKREIVREVDRAVAVVEQHQATVEDRVMRELQGRVAGACGLARSLYEQYQRRPREEIERVIAQALIPGYWHSGSGRFFVVDREGRQIITDSLIEEGNTYSDALLALAAVQSMDEILRVVDERGAGFVRTLSSPIGDEGTPTPMLAYVREFEPLGWVVGVRVCRDEMTARARSEASEHLTGIGLDEGDDYLFVLGDEAALLVHPGRDDPQTAALLPQAEVDGTSLMERLMTAAREPGGGFVRYSWQKPSLGRPVPKLTYVRAVPEWGWTVGTGVYLDDIEAAMAGRRDSMIADFAARLGLTLLAIALLTALSVSISHRLTRALTREFNELEKQLQRSVSDGRAIESDAFEHVELQVIVREINEMQSALRESEACYRTVFENTGTAMCMIAADGTILLANEEFARHTGCSDEEIEEGRHFTDFIAPHDVERVLSYHRARRAGDENVPSSYGMAYLDGEGVERHALVTVELIRGTTTSVASLLDITESKEAEEARARSEERLRTMLENAPCVIYRCRCDSDWTMLFISASIEDICGYPQSDFLADGPRSYASLIHPDDRQMVENAIAEANHRRESFDLEYRIVDSQERVHWVAERGRASFDENDEVLWLDGAIIDITERKEADEALAQSEERFRFLVHHSQDLIWMVQSNGVFSYVSPSWEAILGYEPAYMARRRFQPFVHPDDVAKCEGYMSRVLDAAEALPGPQYRVKHADGTWRWHEGNITPVFADDGSFLYFVGVSRDITERKQTEEALRESEERLALATAGTGIGIWDYDVAENHLQWDENMFEMYGVDPEDFGSTFEDWANCVLPEALPEVGAEFEAALEGEREFSVDFPIVREDGEVRYLAGAAFVSRDERGRATRVVGVNYDITQSRQAEEELRESEQRLSLFFSQHLSGCFFMMLDEPIEWHEDTDKEAALDYAFGHQRMTRVNQAMLQQYEATEEEFVGMTPADLFSHDLKHGREIWRALFDHGRLKVETDERRVDGTQMWIEGDYICLYDDEGRITGHFGVQRDITERKLAAEALRASESRYRLLFNRANDAMYVQPLPAEGVPGSFTAVNDVACEMLGYSREELLGMSLADIEAPGQWQAVPRLLSRLEAGENVIDETVHVTRTGRKIPVEVSSHLFELDGQPTLLSIARDVTERKLAEEKLRESKEMYESLFKACPTSLIVHDIETGEIVDANRRAIAGYGFSSIQELQMNDFWLDPPYSFEDALRLMDEAAREGSRQFEWLNRRADGELFWEQVHLVRATINGVDRILAATTDITAQKQMEQLLRQVNECFLGFTADPMENIGRLIELCGEVLDADWAAYVRLDDRRLRGVACWHLPEGLRPPEDPTGLICEHVVAAGGSDVVALTELPASPFADADPNVRDFGAVSYLGKAVRSHAGTVGCVCTFFRDDREATEEDERLIGIIAAAIRVEEERQQVLKEREQALLDLRGLNRDLEAARREAEEANNLKSEFLANTSHEIRTPLNGIIGYLQLVLNDLCDDREEEREFIIGAHESAEHLLRLINDVLDIARMEAGKLRVDPEEVCVASVLAEVHSVLRVQADQKNIELVFDPVEDDLVAWCDEDRLKQVVVNLVGNAVKFTPENRRVDVHVSACHQEGMIQFEITDTGIGIAPEKLDTIFEKFVQGDGSTTRKRGGSGLGLAISQRIVEMMGGAITAESEGEGRGATFCFTAPLHRGDVRFDPDRPAFAVPDAVCDEDAIALVVEDDPRYREYLCELLAKLGFAPAWAATADDALSALEQLETCVPSVITVDYSLPAREGAHLNTGWDLLVELQKNERLRQTAMILVTGETDVISRKIGTEHLPGQVEVLDKTDVSEELEAYIDRIVVNGDRATPMRILLADDDGAFRRIVARMLAGHGYQLHHVPDGLECLQYLEEHGEEVDLLLLDLRMPGTDGFEVLRQLRHDRTTVDLPVLVVTAYPTPENLEQRMLLAGGGCTRLLTKHEVLAEPSRFHALVERFLEVPRGNLDVDHAHTPRSNAA